MLLYRFQSINKYSIQNLTVKKNWASCVKNFNDPFEFPIGGISKIDEKGQVKYLNSEQEEVRRKIYQNLNKYGVVSYSAYDKDFNQYPEHNILLWSHYGDSHKGFCLVFDVDPIPDYLRKVKYRKTIPELNYEEGENILELLVTKGTEWKYECEYRQFYHTGDNAVDFPGKLVEIVFGCRTSVSDMNFILSLCDRVFDHDIEYSRLCAQDGKLWLSKETWTSRKKGEKVPKHVRLKNDYDFASNMHL